MSCVCFLNTSESASKQRDMTDLSSTTATFCPCSSHSPQVLKSTEQRAHPCCKHPIASRNSTGRSWSFFTPGIQSGCELECSRTQVKGWKISIDVALIQILLKSKRILQQDKKRETKQGMPGRAEQGAVIQQQSEIGRAHV